MSEHYENWVRQFRTEREVNPTPEQIFNAGMERAAEIVKEGRTKLADPLYNIALDDAAGLIRKEIDK